VRVAAGTALLLVALLFQVLLQMYNELLFTFFIFTLTLYALLQARNGYESTLVPYVPYNSWLMDGYSLKYGKNRF
jgi:hypothetical protein